MEKLNTTGMRKLQATRKDYQGFINCAYKTDYSIKAGCKSGEWNVAPLIFDPIPTYEQFIRSFQFKKPLQENGVAEFVYENEEGVVVAYAEVAFSTKLLEIEEFVVDRNYQFQGYGRKFYQEIEQEAKSIGIEEVILQAKGYGAVAFWNRMGFSGGSFCTKFL